MEFVSGTHFGFGGIMLQFLLRGVPMPIRKYIGDGRSFEPDDLKVMSDALTGALAKLGLKDRKDPMVEMVARRIIRAAMAGERNLIRLTEIGSGGREPDHPSK